MQRQILISSLLLMGSLSAEPAVAPIPKGASKATCSNMYTKHTSDNKARWDSTVKVLNTAKTKAQADRTKKKTELDAGIAKLDKFNAKINSAEFVAAKKVFDEATAAATEPAGLYFSAKKVSDGKLNKMLAEFDILTGEKEILANKKKEQIRADAAVIAAKASGVAADIRTAVDEQNNANLWVAQQNKVVPGAQLSYDQAKLEYNTATKTTELTRRDYDNSQQAILDARDKMEASGLGAQEKLDLRELNQSIDDLQIAADESLEAIANIDKLLPAAKLRQENAQAFYSKARVECGSIAGFATTGDAAAKILENRLIDEGKREALQKEENARAALIKTGKSGYPCNQPKNKAGVIMSTKRPVCATGYCCGGANNEKPVEDKDYVVSETCELTTTVNVEYYPPRPSRLSTTAPPVVVMKFACIEGAQQIMLSAAIFLTSAYMMA